MRIVFHKTSELSNEKSKERFTDLSSLVFISMGVVQFEDTEMKISYLIGHSFDAHVSALSRLPTDP